MTPLCRTWALSALALTLVLGACSTAPKDLAAPTLEPQFGSNGDDVGLYVSVAPSGGAYVASIEDITDRYGYVEQNLVLKRFDSSGKQLLSKPVIGSANCSEAVQVSGVDSDANGNALLAFTTFDCEYEYLHISRYSPSGKFLSGNSFYVSGYGSKVAYDSKGNVFYTDYGSVVKGSINGSTSESWFYDSRDVSGEALDIAVSSRDDVYVAGSTGVAKYTNSGNLVWTKPGEAFEAATSGTNVYLRNYKTPTVRKLDVNGKQLWSKTQSGLSGIVIGAMTADANGNVYLTGKYNVSSSNRNIFTRKLNASGKVLWTKTFGTSAYDDARGIATLNGNAIYITGATQGALAHPFRGGENDGYVAKLSSSGNPAWKR